jgi:hypothetical protein
MATTQHFQIQSYRLSMGYHHSHREIMCYGDDGYRLHLQFLPDDEALPPPFTDLAGKLGRKHLALSEFADYLDVLRNEKPLYGIISEDAVTNQLRTTEEPIGGTET